MIAAQHREMASHVRILPLLDILDPCAVDADRDIVLLLARNRACMAADASILVDDESVAHSKPFLRKLENVKS